MTFNKKGKTWLFGEQLKETVSIISNLLLNNENNHFHNND